jgi:hypothetical protein
MSSPWMSPTVMLVDPLGGLLGRGEGVRGAVGLGPVALVGDRLDDHDVAGAGRGGALDGVHPDAAGPHDHHGLPRPDRGDLGRRAPAGRDAAADQRRDLQRDVRLDPHHGRLVHGDVGREGAEQAHRGHALPLGRDAVRAVGDGDAAEQVGAEVAEVLQALRTRRALAARRDEGGDHVIALLHVGHARPDLGDDAGALVPADDGEGRDRGAAGDQVLVGVAQAGGGELDGHLTGSGITDLDLLDRPFLAHAPQDRALGLHRGPFVGLPSLIRMRRGTWPYRV